MGLYGCVGRKNPGYVWSFNKEMLNLHVLFEAEKSRGNAAHGLMNSTSKDIATSSPTNIPPASSTLFQFRPKSLRLTRVVAERPIRVLPHGSFVGGLGPSTSKTTLRVTPCIVRSPSTDSSPSPFFEI